MTQIIDICKLNRMQLHIVGDYQLTNDSVIIYQRPPPKPAGSPISYKTMKQFVHTQEISSQRRQSQQDAAFLDQLRGKTHTEQLAQLMTKCKVVDRSYVPIGEFTGISSRHINCHELSSNVINRRTQEYNEECKQRGIVGLPMVVPCRYVAKTNTTNYKGQLSYQQLDKVFLDKKTSNAKHNFAWELAYYRTADSVQGKSIDHPIYIDTKHSEAESFLYVAASRCRQISQLTLIV
jgi:hypothetical protein